MEEKELPLPKEEPQEKGSWTTVKRGVDGLHAKMDGFISNVYAVYGASLFGLGFLLGKQTIDPNSFLTSDSIITVLLSLALFMRILWSKGAPEEEIKRVQQLKDLGMTILGRKKE